MVSADKQDTPEDKIHAHTKCNSNNAPVEYKSEQGREKQSCSNGQGDRCDHGVFYISGGTQTVSEGAGKRIGQSVKDIVDQHKPDDQRLGPVGDR